MGSIKQLIKTNQNKNITRFLNLFFGFVFVFVSFSFFFIETHALERTVSHKGAECIVDISGEKGDQVTIKTCTKDGSTTLNQVPVDCVLILNPLSDNETPFREQSRSTAFINCNKSKIVFEDGKEREVWDTRGQFTAGILNKAIVFKLDNGTSSLVSFAQWSEDCSLSFTGSQINCDVTEAEFLGTTNAEVPDGVLEQNEVIIKKIDPNDFKDPTKYEDLGDNRYRNLTNQRVYKLNDDNTFVDETTNQQYDAEGNLIQTQTKTENFDETKKHKGGEPLLKIMETIFSLILGIFILIVWFVGWIVHYVFWFIANGFLWVLRVNPASQGLIGVATGPWRLVVQVANVLILGSFTFVGFGYLLDIKSIKQQNKVSDFLVNIVIIAVAINFTLAATTTFVNVVQGVGDVLYLSYVTNGNQCSDTETNSENAICNITESLRTASELRCNEGLAQCNNNNNVFSEIFDAGQNLTILIKEVLYVLIVLYAIFIFLKALRLALFRSVGLWLLMITSPLALVMYLSPLPQLKKYAKDWLQLFWTMAIFYPAFIFGLVVINALAGGFKSAVTDITNENLGSTLGGGVTATALTETQATNIVLGVLTAVIAVFVLQTLVDFFEKSFGGIASAALNGVSGFLGGALRTGGALIAGGVAARNGLSSIRNKGLNIGGKQLTKGRQGKLQPHLDELARQEGELKALEGNNSAAANRQRARIQARMAATQARINPIQNKIDESNRRAANRTRIGSTVQDKILGNAADWIETAPDLLKAAGDVPGAYWKNVTQGHKARVAKKKEEVLGAVEAGVRRNGALYNTLKGAGYNIDADPNMQRFAGLNPQTLQEAEEAYKLKKDNPNASYIKDEINNRATDAFKKTYGIKDKFDREVKDLLLDYSAKKIDDVGGDIDKLDDKDKRLVRTLFEQSADDVGLVSKVLNNKGLTDVVRDQFYQLEPKAVQQIQDIAPSLLPTSEDRRLAGIRAHTDPDAAKKFLGANQQDPDFYNGLINAKGRNVDALAEADKKNGVTGYSILGDSGAKTNKNVTQFSDQFKLTPESDSTTKALNQIYDAQAQKMVATGHPPTNDIISEISRIKEDEVMNPQEKKDAIKAVWEKTDTQVFGDGVVQEDANGKLTVNTSQIDNMGLDDLSKTAVGKDLLKNGLDAKDENDVALYTDAQKVQVMKAGIARAATNNIGERDGNYGTKIEIATDAYSKAIRTKNGLTTSYNTASKALGKLAGNPNVMSEFRKLGTDEEGAQRITYKTLGMNKVLGGVEEDVMAGKPLKYENVEYDLSDMSAGDRSEVLGYVNRVVAGEVGGVRDEAAIRFLEEKGDKTKALVETVLTDQNSGIYSDMISKGQARAKVIEENAQKSAPVNAAGVRVPTNDDYANAIRAEADKEKEGGKKKSKEVFSRLQKAGIGKPDQVKRGTDKDSYDTSNIPGFGDWIVMSMTGGGSPNGGEVIGIPTGFPGGSGGSGGTGGGSTPVIGGTGITTIDTSQYSRNPENDAYGYAVADSGILQNRHIVADKQGGKKELSVDEMVRDYLSPQPQHEYTQEIIDTYNLDKYAVGNDNQIYTSAHEDVGFRGGQNYDFEAVKSQSQADFIEVLSSNNLPGSQQAIDAGFINDNRPNNQTTPAPSNPWDNPPDAVAQYNQKNNIPDNLNISMSERPKPQPNKPKTNKSSELSPKERFKQGVNQKGQKIRAVETGAANYKDYNKTTKANIDNGGAVSVGKAVNQAKDKYDKQRGAFDKANQQYKSSRAQLEQKQAKFDSINTTDFQIRQQQGVLTENEKVEFKRAKRQVQEATQAYQSATSSKNTIEEKMLAAREVLVEKQAARDARMNQQPHERIPAEPKIVAEQIPFNAANMQIPTIVGVSREQAEANVKRYYDAYQKNTSDNMKHYNQLSPEQRRDIAQGGRRSIGNLQKQVTDTQQTISQYNNINQDIDGLVNRAQDRINEAKNTKQGRFLNRDKNQQAIQDNVNQAGANYQQVIQQAAAPGVQRNVENAQVQHIEDTIRQNNEQIGKVAATNKNATQDIIVDGGIIKDGIQQEMVGMRNEEIQEIVGANNAALGGLENIRQSQQAELDRRRAVNQRKQFTSAASTSAPEPSRFQYNESSPQGSKDTTYSYEASSGNTNNVRAEQIVKHTNKIANNENLDPNYTVDPQQEIRPDQIDKASFAKNVNTNQGRASVVSPVKVDLPSEYVNTTQQAAQVERGQANRNNPARPQNQQANTTPFAKTEQFYKNGPIESLRGYSSNGRNVDSLRNQGYSEDDARQIDFAQAYLNATDQNIQRVNSGVMAKLGRQDPSGAKTNDFRNLIKKSKEPKGLRPDELLRLTKYLSSNNN